MRMHQLEESIVRGNQNGFFQLRLKN